MSDKNEKILKSLFRKVNLEHRNLEIPCYIQPLLFTVLKTDPELEKILRIINFVGPVVDRGIFEEYIINTVVLDRCSVKNPISKTTLNKHLDTLNLINAINLTKKKIELTTQGLSFCAGEYVKKDSYAIPVSELELVTKAKIISFENSLTLEKTDEYKCYEKEKIYIFENGFVILNKTKDETIKKFTSRLQNKISEINSSLRDEMLEIHFENQHNKEKEIEQEIEQKYNKFINQIENMQTSEEVKQQKKHELDKKKESALKRKPEPTEIDHGEYNMDIYIPQQIYVNHKEKIDDICKYYEKNLEGSGYDLTKTLSGVDIRIGRMKIIYNVKTF